MADSGGDTGEETMGTGDTCKSLVKTLNVRTKEAQTRKKNSPLQVTIINKKKVS